MKIKPLESLDKAPVRFFPGRLFHLLLYHLHSSIITVPATTMNIRNLVFSKLGQRIDLGGSCADTGGVFVSDIGSFDPSNIEVAVEVISQAFFDDPMYVHIEPDEVKRMRVLKAQMGMAVKMFLRAGLIDSTPDAKGVIVWLPPGNTSPSPIVMLQSGALAVPFRSGFRSFFRLMSMLSAGDDAHNEAAPGPHWYLGITAVDPSLQGKGIGTALIEHGLERADADGLPCYLETSRERNVSFWEKFGFRVSHTDFLPNGGPRFWGMLRAGSS